MAGLTQFNPGNLFDEPSDDDIDSLIRNFLRTNPYGEYGWSSVDPDIFPPPLEYDLIQPEPGFREDQTIPPGRAPVKRLPRFYFPFQPLDVDDETPDFI